MRSLVSALAVLVAGTSVATADWWSDRKREAEGIVRQVAPVVAPGATIGLQVLQGKDPVKAATDTAAAQARIIVSGGQAVAAIDQAAEDKIKQAIGGELAKVIEIVRLPGKFERQVAIQTVATVAEAMEKQKLDLKQIGTVPFAAALQQAIDLYSAVLSRCQRQLPQC